MKIDHVCGGHIYLISNFGVARNPLFSDDSDIKFFRSNVEKYLGKLCDIIAYDLSHNQFQILLRVKWRNLIKDFFIFKQKSTNNKKYMDLFSEKLGDQTTDNFPETYKIFSQEVSNMLNSYAKYFNFKYKRKGGLFGSRYSKLLIESEREMEEWVRKLNNQVPLVEFETAWKTNTQYNGPNKKGEESSNYFYNKHGYQNFQTIFSNFMQYFRMDLRGCFNSLPPSNLKNQNFKFLWLLFITKNGYLPPW